MSSEILNGNSHAVLSLILSTYRTRKVIMEIMLPAAQVTSVTFDGQHLDILYVTTAAQEKTGPQSKEAGHLFRVRGLGVQGFDGVEARV